MMATPNGEQNMTDQTMEKLIESHAPILRVICGFTRPDGEQPRPGAYIETNAGADFSTLPPHMLAHVLSAGVDALYALADGLAEQTGQPIHQMLADIQLQHRMADLLGGTRAGKVLVHSNLKHAKKQGNDGKAED